MGRGLAELLHGLLQPGAIPGTDRDQERMGGKPALPAGNHRDSAGEGAQRKAGFVFHPCRQHEGRAARQIAHGSGAVADRWQRVMPAFAGFAEDQQFVLGAGEGCGQLMNSLPCQSGSRKKPPEGRRRSLGSRQGRRHHPVQ